MKDIPYTAPPLAGEDGQKSGLWRRLLGNLAEGRYYEARSGESGAYILWMEFSHFGQLRAYPCVLHELDGEPLVFRPHTAAEPDEQNQALLERWTELVTPERFPAICISSLEKDAFRKIYRAYRSGEIQ